MKLSSPKKSSLPSDHFAKVVSSLNKEHSLRLMADKTGIPRTTLYNYMHGTSQPSADNIGAFCRAFNLTPNEVLGFE